MIWLMFLMVTLPHIPSVLSASHGFLRNTADHRKMKKDNVANHGGWPEIEFSPRAKVMKQQPRIVGGSTAGFEDYPYYVQWDGCGGSLIGKNAILTAAHCLNRTQLDPTLWIGAYHPDKNDGLERRVDGVVFHPDYYQHGTTIRYDFALLLLEESVSESAVQPVQLDRDEGHSMFDYEELTVIGMGLSEYDRKNNSGRFPKELQELKVRYVPFDECEEEYGLYNVSMDEASQFCGGGKHFEDACMGDSGGPVLDEDGIQVGVISFGVKCGDWGLPSVYSRISSVIHWIDDFICLNAEDDLDCPQESQKRFPVRFDIQPDEFPQEISWGIWKQSESYTTNLLYIPFVSVQNFGMYSKILYLSPGKYMFSIRDEGGNGLCCDFGEGNYSINSAADSIFRNGTYKSLDSIEFVVTESGRLGYSQFSRLRIDITYDNRPEDTAWRLDNIDTNSMIFASNFGDITWPGLLSFAFNNIANARYSLIVADAERNGICCDDGEGSIEIYKLVGDNEVLIGSSSGNFTWQTEFEFELP